MKTNETNKTKWKKRRAKTSSSSGKEYIGHII
jgi:hypothetical protein